MANRISSPADLKAVKAKALADIELRNGKKDMRVTVHMGTCGIAAGAREILAEIMDGVRSANADNVTIQQAGCAGLCDQEPMVTVTDKSGNSFIYGRLDKNKVRRIVDEHVLRGNEVQELKIRNQK
jgi:NADP-reducing hydrogenase subunit HndB